MAESESQSKDAASEFRARERASFRRFALSWRERRWDSATLEAVSSARSSAREGNTVASRGEVVVGVEMVDVQMVISAELLRGCVRVRMVVGPDACSVYTVELADVNDNVSWSRFSESLSPSQIVIACQISNYQPAQS